MEEEIQGLNMNDTTRKKLLMELRVRTENAPTDRSFLLLKNIR